MSIGFPSQFRRLKPALLDSSSVQESQSALQEYLKGGTAVPGQLLGVRTGDNTPGAYIVNEDLTASVLGGCRCETLAKGDCVSHSLFSIYQGWADQYINNRQFDGNVTITVGGNVPEPLTFENVRLTEGHQLLIRTDSTKLATDLKIKNVTNFRIEARQTSGATLRYLADTVEVCNSTGVISGMMIIGQLNINNRSVVTLQPNRYNLGTPAVELTINDRFDIDDTSRVYCAWDATAGSLNLGNVVNNGTLVIPQTVTAVNTLSISGYGRVVHRRSATTRGYLDSDFWSHPQATAAIVATDTSWTPNLNLGNVLRYDSRHGGTAQTMTIQAPTFSGQIPQGAIISIYVVAGAGGVTVAWNGYSGVSSSALTAGSWLLNRFMRIDNTWRRVT